MNIGDAAKRSGLPAKTIRYYETIGLVAPARRADNGYRHYREKDVAALHFLQRARSTGFSIDECRQLLDLYQDQGRHSADVKALVLDKVGQIDRQLEQLQSMRTTLFTLAGRCSGDEGPHCAIIDALADE